MDIAIGVFHRLYEPITKDKVADWNTIFEHDHADAKLTLDGKKLYRIMYRLPYEDFIEIGGMTMNIRSAIDFLDITRKYPDFVISNQFEFFVIMLDSQENSKLEYL